LLIHHDKGVPPTQDELRLELESSDVQTKIRAMKTMILWMLNGESMPKLLMTVIRYCVTTQNHELKKLLSLYWEIVRKYGDDGKLLPEMILVCNAILMDLKHPNHFIRGCTLRFLCRSKEAEIIQPLVPAIEENLSHGDAYVRKNAVMCVYSVQVNFPEHDFFPDAAELIQNFLQSESDLTARRNAFLMLFKVDQERAVSFYAENADSVMKFGDGFQLIILEMTRKVCRQDPAQKSRFIKVLFQLLQSASSAVAFEAAWTLVSLSAAPTAVRAAATSYTNLLNNSESDNNVKLIVLEKLNGLRKHHGKILQELLMDILRVLNSPNIDIRRKTLEIAMELVSPRNINEVVLVLKKEVVKTQSKDVDKTESLEYRQMLIKSIHSCAVKYPSIADSVVHLLMDFLSGPGALDVVLFVREIVETYENLRDPVLTKLIDSFQDIQDPNVYRVALWILGEYALDSGKGPDAIEVIYECLGPVPFSKKKAPKEEDEEAAEEEKVKEAKTSVTVLADGTYATQTALTTDAEEVITTDDDPVLRKMLLSGNYLLGASVVSSLLKIILKTAERLGKDNMKIKEQTVKFLITCCSMIQAGQNAPSASRMDRDSYERITFCIRAILDPEVEAEIHDVLLKDCRSVLADLLEEQKEFEKAHSANGEEGEQMIQPDSILSFRQLKSRRGLGATDVDLDDEGDLNKAKGLDETQGLSEHLAHVHQLTGFSDPVYAEAQVSVHDFDIVLNILVINRTPNTLTNLAVELATMGDLKLVEKPQSFTIGAMGHRRFKANIKVSSTETGQIFGTIVYDSANSVDTTYVNLNEIHVDIMDYIKPASCSDAVFRSMWAEFEWENKVAVDTAISDVNDFLQHIVESTNMKCLTPVSALGGDCNFLAANLYAKSVFGEDALVNVSVEKVLDKVEGYIRIRAKTQGIALSLGDRITLKQRNKDSTPVAAH